MTEVIDSRRREFLGATALIISGDILGVPAMTTIDAVAAEDAFPKATGTKDKELFKIEGAQHIETYWVPEYVDAALGKLAPFFDRTLV